MLQDLANYIKSQRKLPIQSYRICKYLQKSIHARTDRTNTQTAHTRIGENLYESSEAAI